jgi:TP901 family phage tail tape measure protein
MAQYVGAVYLDIRFDPGQASRDLTRTMGGAGAAAGAATGAAMSGALSDSLGKFGNQATKIGRQLSIGISAPIIALGAASDKAFLAYDTNLTKVAALTGAGATQTQEWSQQVLDLASRYGIAGEDAANALYLITSSGIKGQAAIATLDTTLKASAVGMGDAATVAGLLTSAMNAYGEGNLSAAQAADVLAGAVQESKVPADQLAGSISNLLPFGKQLSVGFDQITGAMAALSLQGTNAAMAATQLRGIFNGLLDPSAQAAKAFTRLGLNVKDLRTTLSTQGIVPTLRKIRDAIVANGGESDSELAEIFGNVRALTGAFGLLNDEGGKVDRVFANTALSAGKLDKAFLVTADSAGFKSRQALEGLHNEMSGLGEAVAPVVTALATVARGGLEVVNALGPLKYVLAVAGTGLAVLGPLAFTVGSVATAFSAVTGASTGAAVAQGALAAATEANVAAQAQLTAAESAVAAAAAAESFALNAVGGSAVAGAAATQALVAAEAELVVAAEAATAAEAELAAATAAAGGSMAAVAAVIGAVFVPAAAAVVAIGGSVLLWKIRMDQAQESANRLGDTFGNVVAGGGIQHAQETIAKTSEQIKELSDDVDNSHAPWDADYREEIRKGIAALQAHTDATRGDIDMANAMATASGENADKLFQWLSNERNAGRTYKSSAEAMTAYNTAVAAHPELVQGAVTASGKLADATKEISDKFFGVQSAQKAYTDALDKVDDAQRKAEDASRKVDDARRAEQDAVQKVTDAHQKHADALNKVTEAQGKLSAAQATLNELLAGPTKAENLDVRQAQINVRKAQEGLRTAGSGTDRQQAQIDVQRARLALTDARGAHAKNLAKAQEDVKAAQDNLTQAQRAAVDAATAIGDAERGVADAHRAVSDAQRDALKAQQDITQAKLDAGKAADDLNRKTEEFATALINSNDGAGKLATYLGQLKELYPQAGDGIQSYLDRALALQAFYDTAPAPDPNNTNGVNDNRPDRSYGSGGRAYGGPLSAGQGSTVNEKGLPELWAQGGKQYLMPLTAGRVIPLKPMLDVPVRGGDGFNVGDINVYEVSGQPRQTAYEVRRELRKESFLSGRRP